MINLQFIKDMRKHCKENKYCVSIDTEKVCPFRNECIDFLKSGVDRYTPSQCDIDELYRHFKVGRWENSKTKKQKVYNKDLVKADYNPIYRVWYKFQWYWIKQKGFTLCDDWKTFENFVCYYNKRVSEGYTLIVNPRTENKIIDENSIILFKQRKMRSNNEVNMNDYQK